MARLRPTGESDPTFGQGPLQGVVFDVSTIVGDGALDSQHRLVNAGSTGVGDGYAIGRWIVQPTVVP